MRSGMKERDDTVIDGEIEKKDFDDLIVVGTAVPAEIKDGRKTVCAVAFSEEYGLIRIYPVPPKAKVKIWHIISVPLERNKHDSRKESWKIQGSKTEWDTLSDKIKLTGELSRKKRISLIKNLQTNYSYDCVEDINDQKKSLGIIIPEILDRKYIKREDFEDTIQSKLFDEPSFKTIQNYPTRPVVTYRCPKCRTQKKHHKQGILEWGMYEGIRKGYTEEDMWNNLHIDDPEYDLSFLVGNMNRHRSSFMIISVFRYKTSIK